MLLALVPIIHTQLQMVTLTMMALAMSEDSIRLHARRNEIIDALGMLTEHIKEVQQMIASLSQPMHACTACREVMVEDYMTALSRLSGVRQVLPCVDVFIWQAGYAEEQTTTKAESCACARPQGTHLMLCRP